MPWLRPAHLLTLSDLRALAILCLAVCLFFWRLLLHPSHVLFSGFSDLLLMNCAWQELIRKTLLEQGEMPFWYPHIFCGISFIGIPGCWAFYPLNWLFVLLPVNLSASALILTHSLIGAAGSYCHLRWGLRVSPHAALLGALAFLFSGKWIMHLLVAGHLGFLPLAWMPWTLLAVDALARKPSGAATGVLAGCLGILGVSLYPQLAFYSALLVAAYGGWRLSSAPPAFRGILLGCLVAAAGLAGLLCAVQLLPAIESAKDSARAALIHFSFASAGSLRIEDVVAFLRPTGEAVAGPAGDVFGWEKAFHLGLLPLLLLPYALARREWRRETIFFLVVSALAVLHALGDSTPLFSFLYHHVPGFGYHRVASRTLFVLGLVIPCLIALGAEAAAACRGRSLLLPAGAAAALAIALSFGWGDAAWLSEAGPWLLTAAALDLAAFGLADRWGPTATRLPGFLVPGLLLETLSFLYPLQQTRDFSSVYDLGRLQELGMASRFFPEERVTDYDREVFHPLLPEYLLVRHGGYDVNGFNPMVSARYVGFLSRVTGEAPRPEVWIPHLKPAVGSPLLDLLGLRLRFAEVLRPGVEEGPGLALVESPSALPRAFVVPSREVVRDADRLLDRLASGGADPRRTVLLEADSPETPGSATFTPIPFGHYSPNHLELAAKLESPGYLVLSEAWHPGWRCRDRAVGDGHAAPARELEVYRANYLFRAVYLSEGSHHLEFRFEPRSIRSGLALSLLGLLLLVFLFSCLKSFARS
ncbi:MAG: hypothetical protein HYU36_17995 [Planctomycetes bacterium]|nr:hypothetical protein [Planctomycetota bacterium]